MFMIVDMYRVYGGMRWRKVDDTRDEPLNFHPPSSGLAEWLERWQGRGEGSGSIPGIVTCLICDSLA